MPLFDAIDIAFTLWHIYAQCFKYIYCTRIQVSLKILMREEKEKYFYKCQCGSITAHS
jgi:hypothetical protein